MTSALQSLRYSKDGEGKPQLAVLDQLLIPDAKEFIDIPDVEAAWSVIRKMQIRGAPLIAIVAVLGLSVDLNSNPKTIAELQNLDDSNQGEAVMAFIKSKMDYLATARPTAVNVFNALEEVREALKAEAAQPAGASDEGANGASGLKKRLCRVVSNHAEFMLKRDVSDNEAIGKFGAEAILRHLGADADGARVVTICNTGSLATAGYGTALGVVRALQQRGKLKSIHALETRPYNQGSRLTAFEIMEEKMPGGTLICDSASAILMQKHGVDAVVVGADRVCRNGDTANKIGTFSLALIAAAHGVPFYVASPFTTLDTNLASGEDIVIEERSAEELIQTSKAPPGMPCWNPAFDVTPAKYIWGIITEKGVLEPSPGGVFDVKGFVEKHSSGAQTEQLQKASTKLVVPVSYEEQSVESLPGYLAKNAPVAMEKLEVASADELSCKEVGDGNLNLVFIVTNTKKPEKQIIVKQALPYVRCVGESWPLTLDRSFFEYKALVAEKESCPQFVPSIYFFSKPHGLMVMEYIPPPNIILRKGLIQGIRYPTVASDMGIFCAHTLFKTSGFKLTATEIREQVQFWMTNTEMCALTEQVIYTEPYITAANNRWTSPQLDDDKRAIEEDVILKVEASKLKTKFVTETQALIHGDLHSGSIMCSPADHQTFVIDPEFAFYGPMGFDTGAFMGNLLLNYCSQSGHRPSLPEYEYAGWVLEQVVAFWKTFETEFVKLWNDPSEHTGMKFKRSMLSRNEDHAEAQKAFLRGLFLDTLGFAGMKMLRRVVGIAHVEDLDSIEDPDVRASCERHALTIAKYFIKERSSLSNIEDVVELAKKLKP